MRRMLGALAALVIMTAGCGGSDDAAAPDPDPTVTIEADGTEGVPAPQALSEFACAADDEGAWNASGLISNTGADPISYRVTVYVGPADGEPREAVDDELPLIQADGSARFEIADVPAHGEDPTCHVQVVELDE